MANEQDQSKIDLTSLTFENPKTPYPCCARARFFEIKVRGQLSDQWSDWLDGLEMKFMDNGEMILYGPIVDQAALMGILNKLNRLNLTLLSVNELKKIEQSEEN